MSQVFTTVAKLWPTGEELDVGEDYNDVGVPATFNREAQPYISPNGTDSFQFLFWNTGRHLTSKRKVKWVFTQTSWSVWTATRWYGVPPTGPGASNLVRADAFSISGDESFTATPIDGDASSFVNGSGVTAWPFEGDDHVATTQFGAATLGARDPFVVAGISYFFAGWLKLKFGGEASGTFVETDTTSDGDSAYGVFEPTPGQTYTAAQGTSAMLLAAYGKPKSSRPDFGRLLDLLGKLGTTKPGFESVFDPNPEDYVRLKLITELLAAVGASTPANVEVAAGFEAVVRDAKTMSAAELKRALTTTRAAVRRGEAAVAALEVALKKANR